ncbi:MAG: polysaccharide deacetylase family protein, partial [Oxalobacter sp.]|nr:polysaccharide deacetylase family protein [Oxalobacter sp.]
MIAHILTTAKRFALGFMLALCTFATAATAANTETPIPSFITLCYHNVVPALGNGIIDDTAPVSQEELKTHFDWLKENGYHIISVKDVLKAKETGKPLPPKSVLLSFDDGYSSFYEIVYPMLKSYGYTAFLSLETGWLETPEGELVEYGGRTRLPRSAFLNWQQIREMADSGIVELASHSHNLHRGHQGNPQ